MSPLSRLSSQTSFYQKLTLNPRRETRGTVPPFGAAFSFGCSAVATENAEIKSTRHNVVVNSRTGTEINADAQTPVKSLFPSKASKSNGSTSGTRLRGNAKSRVYPPPQQTFVSQSLSFFRNAPKFGARRTLRRSTAKDETTEPNATR